MDYKVFFSEDSLGDLDETLGFIREDQEIAAERLGMALINHVSLLSSFPYVGAPVTQHRGIRKLLHTPINIYYRVHEDKKLVEILHFWHASRRPPKFS